MTGGVLELMVGLVVVAVAVMVGMIITGTYSYFLH
jgi:hypothetical protein